MKAQINILSQLKKAKLPSVSFGFFDTFSDDIMYLIDLEENTSGLLNELDLKRFKNDSENNLNVDFEGFSSNEFVVVDLPVKSNKTKSLLLWTSGIAACFLLYFATPFLTYPSEIAETVSSEELLLAYLDEDDMVDFILDDISAFKEDSIALEDELLYEELEDGIFDYLNDLQ